MTEAKVGLCLYVCGVYVCMDLHVCKCERRSALMCACVRAWVWRPEVKVSGCSSVNLRIVYLFISRVFFSVYTHTHK